MYIVYIRFLSTNGGCCCKDYVIEMSSLLVNIYTTCNNSVRC